MKPSPELFTLYTGRFAPSPTGPLHLGSLYTALASYLDARFHQGRWLVRIDDIDTPRNVAGASDDILWTLETFGLYWDGGVYYQSQQLDYYQAWLNRLKNKHLLYPCTCSRKTLAQATRSKCHPEHYPGICKNKTFPQTRPYATRIRVEHGTIEFFDALHGNLSENLATRHGDYIIKRKDQIFAYQFAVVIDDYAQQVNHIVRGADLLDSTPKQIYLQQQLELPRTNYMHVPLITDQHGNKLSKQTFAQAVDRNNPRRVLFKLLELLRQSPPSELADCSLTEILEWGITHWKPSSLNNIETIYPDSDSPLPPTVD
ncbi:MAG: tRNA glutamyl-Q(34) synthetase GluQRS [Gammaproteobacteria bacterium]